MLFYESSFQNSPGPWGKQIATVRFSNHDPVMTALQKVEKEPGGHFCEGKKPFFSNSLKGKGSLLQEDDGFLQ